MNTSSSKAPKMVVYTSHYSTSKKIDTMRPMRLRGANNHLGMTELDVFNDENGKVILSFSNQRGTFSIPLSRRMVATLMSRLSFRLV